MIGTLRGYDAFLNVVLEDVESTNANSDATRKITGQVVVRGNSVIQFEALERVN